MATVEKDIAHKNKVDESSFSSTLKTAIDLSSSASITGQDNASRYYYTVGSYNFLLEDDLKAETLKNERINHVPFLPEWHSGIISIRGIIMPVIDIHAFVLQETNKKEKSHEGKSYLLKLEHANHPPIVFKVDKLPELINVKDAKKTKVTKNSPSWMHHCLKQGSAKIHQINHTELLNKIITAQ